MRYSYIKKGIRKVYSPINALSCKKIMKDVSFFRFYL